MSFILFRLCFFVISSAREKPLLGLMFSRVRFFTMLRFVRNDKPFGIGRRVSQREK